MTTSDVIIKQSELKNLQIKCTASHPKVTNKTLKTGIIVKYDCRTIYFHKISRKKKNSTFKELNEVKAKRMCFIFILYPYL